VDGSVNSFGSVGNIAIGGGRREQQTSEANALAPLRSRGIWVVSQGHVGQMRNDFVDDLECLLHGRAKLSGRIDPRQHAGLRTMLFIQPRNSS
jgi:hypothetical protein